MEYRLILGRAMDVENLREFVEEVTTMMTLGWEPLGGLALTHESPPKTGLVCGQAMIKARLTRPHEGDEDDRT